MIQFTHPRGVRQKMRREADEAMTFQFTHPRGVRLGIVPSALAEGDVSIHAPARGATYPCTTEEWNKLFQFTHPQGVRLINTITYKLQIPFQFTHPQGVRPARGDSPDGGCRFTSRTRKGCDTPEFSPSSD